MSRQPTARGAETRQQLIDFATRCFTEHGYYSTTVAQIVDGVGVGKGVFYWYFSSKEELFRSLLDEAWRDLRIGQEAVIGNEVDALRRIELYIRTTIAWTAENVERAQLFRIAETEGHLRDLLRSGRDEALNYVQRHVEAGMEAGQIPRGDSVIIAASIRAVLMTVGRLVADEHTVQELADAAAEFVLHGIGVSKAELNERQSDGEA